MPQLPGWESAPGEVAMETKVSAYNKFQTQQHKVTLDISPKLGDCWWGSRGGGKSEGDSQLKGERTLVSYSLDIWLAKQWPILQKNHSSN